MQIKHSVRQKIRPKIITLLLTLTLLINLMIPTIEVQADTDTTGTGTSFGGETTSAGQPPSYQKTAWLFYICDSNRQLLTPVVFVPGTNKVYGANYDKSYLTSRIGNQAPSIFVPAAAPWGPPVTSSGSNWAHVKADLNVNGLTYVRQLFGEEIATRVKNGDQTIHVILETVSWHNKPGKPAGNPAVASCSGWSRMAQAGGCTQSGFGWYPFNKIAVSEYLEFQWQGLGV